jgi:ABC-type branched-subunit amino acid transport system substrate-binding protein
MSAQHRRSWGAVVATLALLAAGCGGDDSSDADGVESGPGISEDAIRVAIMNDFSGPIATIGNPAAVGAEMYFATLNEEGGVCDRQIETVRYDTQYDTQQAVQGYREISGDVAFITQLLGTNTVLALADSVERDNITTLAGTLAASVIEQPSLYVYQTPFALEAVNGIAWAAENEAGEDDQLQLGIIYQGDAFGEEGLAAAQYTADQLSNIDIVASESYAVTDESFTAQVTAMEQAGAEVVYLHATPAQTAGVLGVAAQRNYDALFIGNSSTYASDLVEPLGELLDSYRVVTSTANWGDGEAPAMEELMDAREQHAPDTSPDNWMVTGWISGEVTAQVLEEACEDGDLTREGIATAADGLTVDLELGPPEVLLSDSEVPARTAIVNEIDLETAFPSAITEVFTSEPAESWSLEDLPS